MWTLSTVHRITKLLYILIFQKHKIHCISGCFSSALLDASLSLSLHRPRTFFYPVCFLSACSGAERAVRSFLFIPTPSPCQRLQTKYSICFVVNLLTTCQWDLCVHGLCKLIKITLARPQREFWSRQFLRGWPVNYVYSTVCFCLHLRRAASSVNFVRSLVKSRTRSVPSRKSYSTETWTTTKDQERKEEQNKKIKCICLLGLFSMNPTWFLVITNFFFSLPAK